ncbi:acetyl-CoA synthetase-like protein [Aspergillus affinis]|uniref:acetyl-CoA synthetase-like protein n=1 Tax=Aspergillus affinis TaxID=1070780 RepID=UPI0022FDE101|nr:acetyl-CoA synthetase-like protein [Aspergillus affinis]KAI9035959.1 acetyl-CoA synthetase-like protein [Aspergillus affinis]
MISSTPPISHDVVSFALDARADYDPSEALFIDAQYPSRYLNGLQFPLLVRTLIAGLKAHGVEKGDCVVVHTGNNVLYTALFLAIIGTGGIYMGSNPHSSVDEFNRVVQLTKPRLIITEEDALSTVLAVSDKNNIQSQKIFIIHDASIDATIAFAHGKGQLPVQSPNTHSPPSITSFLSHQTADHVLITDPETAKSAPAALYLTSGTTGLPKAAVLTHAALIARHHAILYTPPYKITRLVCLPIFHVFTSLWTHLFPIRYGHPLYILRGFQLPVFLDTVKRYQISETYLVPVVVHALNQGPASLDVVPSLSSLRYIGLSGAPIDRDSMAAFQDILHPDACAGQVWGMTECGVVIQNQYPETGRLGQGDLGSIGRVLPGYEAKLVPTNTDGVSAEEKLNKDGTKGQRVSGQLHVRGLGLFSEYLGQGESVVDDQGWFSTGDVAYVNDHGEYVIVGRTKELIKVRGYQVSPAEIEAVLLKHPLITDIAVMGITLSDGSTEAPCAYVVRTGGTKGKLTAEEVFDFVQQRLASYKVLDGGVYFVERIPRTVNGKLQRGKLAELNKQREMLAGLLGKMKMIR